MAGTTGLKADALRSETLTDAEISPSAGIREEKLLFNESTGHRHSGAPGDGALISGVAVDPPVVDGAFTGAINGLNTTYTLASNFVSGTVAAYVDGVRQKRTVHYTEVGPNQVQFSAPVLSGKVLCFDWRRA